MSGDRIDHATEAREILGRLMPRDRENGPQMGRGYWSMYEAAQVDALRGIGHALLAIHETLGGTPLAGWVEVTGAEDVARTFLPVHVICSTCGKASPDVKVRVNPYKEDVEGDSTPEPLCDRCEQNAADDI